MLPKLGPTHIGAQTTPHASPSRVARHDNGMLDRPAPGSGFFLQSRPRATLANQVPNLVEGNEVGHLSPHGSNSYVQRARSAAASLKRTPRPTTCFTQNPVLGAQLVDVAVEDLWIHGPGHHGNPNRRSGHRRRVGEDGLRRRARAERQVGSGMVMRSGRDLRPCESEVSPPSRCPTFGSFNRVLPHAPGVVGALRACRVRASCRTTREFASVDDRPLD
jgi:hypothetical protein